MVSPLKSAFQWDDPLLFAAQLQPEEAAARQCARDYAQTRLMPRITKAFTAEKFSPEIMREMGQLGLLGATLSDYGCKGHSYIAYGLIAHEIEKVDSAYRSALSIQSSLVMHAIHTFGSEQQKTYYLPRLAAGELIGCFGLTEPDYGSDPGNMQTAAVETRSGYLINGQKKWIGLAPVADIFIIWAKNAAGRIRGYIVDKTFPGIAVTPITDKLSLRAAAVGEVTLKNVPVPYEQELPDADGLSAPLACLDNARYGIAWGALGAATFCWHTARDYVLRRHQFGQPLAANQLIQLKLANMQTQISLGMQACLRVGQLKAEQQAATPMISMIKRNSALVALEVARTARDMLGANGILAEQHVMRHLMNLETVNTYEGTQDIHALILGRAQTGIQAFKPRGNQDGGKQ